MSQVPGRVPERLTDKNTHLGTNGSGHDHVGQSLVFCIRWSRPWKHVDLDTSDMRDDRSRTSRPHELKSRSSEYLGWLGFLCVADAVYTIIHNAQAGLGLEVCYAKFSDALEKCRQG